MRVSPAYLCLMNSKAFDAPLSINEFLLAGFTCSQQYLPSPGADQLNRRSHAGSLLASNNIARTRQRCYRFQYYRRGRRSVTQGTTSRNSHFHKEQFHCKIISRNHCLFGELLGVLIFFSQLCTTHRGMLDSCVTPVALQIPHIRSIGALTYGERVAPKSV